MRPFYDMFQMHPLKKYTTYLLGFFLFSYSTAAFCDGPFYVIWRDIGLPDAARLVSQYSGREIRLASNAKGVISIASTDPLTSNAVFFAFEKSIRERGLTMVQERDNAYLVKPADSEPDVFPPPVVKRQYIGAVFAFEQRAQSIVSRLNAAGGEAEVLVADNSSEKTFSVALSYLDCDKGYQAMASAVERAGLNNLISLPALPSVSTVLEK
jgi:hypothetical protein